MKTHNLKKYLLFSTTALISIPSCIEPVPPPPETPIYSAEGERCNKDDNIVCNDGLTCMENICYKVCQTDNDCDVRSQHCGDNSYCIPGSNIVCGNGILEAGENCDDGNNNDGDGCNSTCNKESGWTCLEDNNKTVCSPICGDGTRVGEELTNDNGCDDGNSVLTDDCPSGANGTCKKATCGDGFLHKTGVNVIKCSDGVTASGDNVCAEECDDGNNEDGDGCSANCTIEHGWSCLDANSDGSLTKCGCAENFSGDNCNECIADHFGLDCQACPSTANGVCNSRGVCDDGINGSGECECDDGYSDYACDGCAIHHTMDDSGVCICATGWGGDSGTDCNACAPGYFGPDCVNTCPGFDGTTDNICNNHGICNDGLEGDGSCDCNTDSNGVSEGWDVDDNGSCTICAFGWAKDENGVCNKCAPGFFGNLCIGLCNGAEIVNGAIANVCNDNGSCADGKLGDGSCACNPGVAGESCSGCDGHRTNKPACDLCESGYFGADCEQACPGKAEIGNSCYGHGTCDYGPTASGLCTCNGNWDVSLNCNECKEGFGGSDCNSECPGGATNQCNGHGSCIDGKNNQANCLCDGNWTGAACDSCKEGFGGSSCQLECPGGATNQCNGHGTCIDGLNNATNCICSGNFDGEACDKCKVGWTGAKCDTCDEGYFGPDCSQKCPGFAEGKEICYGRGSCDYGLTGSGKCLSCNGNWDNQADCNECKDGYYGLDCSKTCIGGAGAKQCNGHGTCKDGTTGNGICISCTSHWDLSNSCSSCSEGWDGQDCEVCATGYWGESCSNKTTCNIAHGTASEGLSGNGHCSECNIGWAGEDCTICAAGYYGANCQAITCDTKHGTASEGLSGNGKCKSCEAGYFGENCSSYKTCQNGIADDGIIGNGTCKSCNDGYYGTNCESKNTCKNGTPNGDIKGDGTCKSCNTGWDGKNCDVCKSGYYGANCQPVTCDTAHGIADEGLSGKGQCLSCNPGYYGANCDKAITCKYGKPNEGITGDGTCKSCNTGYYGANCDKAITCKNGTANGDITGDGTCKSCNTGYYGANCDKAITCKNGTANEGITGDGTCKSCNTGWSGTNCDACASNYFGSTCQPVTCVVANGKANDGLSGNGQCSSCNSGFFGVNCDKANTCKNGTANGGTTGDGTCKTCNPGYYGNNCEKSITCKNGTPSQGTTGTGHCLSCNTGWDGQDCDKCATNYYGSTCKAVSCDTTHGTASDGLGGTGTCKSCNPGYYGTNCSTAVSCKNGTPKDGIEGDGKCSECKTGYYGENCEGYKTCKNGTAKDGLTGDGHCSVCTSAGYYGPDCDKASTCNTSNGTVNEGVNGTGLCSSCKSGTGWTGDTCNTCGTGWTGTSCNSCASGYGGTNCSSQCPGGATNQCNGNGTCTASLGVTPTCTCIKGYTEPDCKSKMTIAAPAIDASAPFANTVCDNNVVGWTNASGSALAIKFTHAKINASGYQFQCRSNIASKINDAAWQNISGSSCTVSKNSSYPGGKYTTQIRVVYGAAISDIASYSYYVTPSLNGEACCSSITSAGINAAITKAASDIPTSSTFSSVSQVGPDFTLIGVESAYPTSFRKKFQLSADKKFVALTRHTRSRHWQKGTGNQCKIYAYLGSMIDKTTEDYYNCGENNTNGRINLFKYLNNSYALKYLGSSTYSKSLPSSYSNKIPTDGKFYTHTSCTWKLNSNGTQYCENYRYIWQLARRTLNYYRTGRCVSTTDFKKQALSHHIDRTLHNCDVMVFNAAGDIACYTVSGTTATLNKRVIGKHISGYSPIPYSSAYATPGFRMLNGDEYVDYASGSQPSIWTHSRNLFSWKPDADFCDRNSTVCQKYDSAINY